MHKQKKRLTLRKIAQSTHSSLQRILQIELYGLLCYFRKGQKKKNKQMTGREGSCFLS